MLSEAKNPSLVDRQRILRFAQHDISGQERGFRYYENGSVTLVPSSSVSFDNCSGVETAKSM
jgi:hypothetical protein